MGQAGRVDTTTLQPDYTSTCFTHDAHFDDDERTRRNSVVGGDDSSMSYFKWIWERSR